MVVALVLAASVHARTAAAAPALSVTVVVDKVVAKRGEILAYNVHVTNLGDEPAQGLRITSHYPEQTAEAPTDGCPIQTDPCFHVDASSPGLGDGVHQVTVHRVPPLPPDGGVTLRFRVRVDDDAVIGSYVVNHAHAFAVNHPEVTSAPVKTRIVGDVPNAVAGGSLFSASGKLVTDSFDSSLGTYEQTQQNAHGSIASNGPISVTGGSVVNGDATPGPGFAVSVSNNSTVTGSTAPSDAPFVVDELDAGPAMAANDNGRICRTPGSCDGATYDPAARSLVVTGSAVLPSGSYALCTLDVSGTLTIDGAATIWIAQPDACPPGASVRVRSHALVGPASGSPMDLQLLVDGSPDALRTVALSAQSSFVGVVHGAHTTMVIDGGSHLFGGAAVGEVAAGAGGAFVHWDRALNR